MKNALSRLHVQCPRQGNMNIFLLQGYILIGFITYKRDTNSQTIGLRLTRLDY